MAVDPIAEQHALRQVSLARRAAAELGRLWRQVDPDGIVASWRSLLPQALVMLGTSQAVAAASSGTYVDDALEAQGVAADAAGRIVPGAFAGIASDGRPLATLLLQPAITALDQIGAGASPTRALTAGRFTLDLITRTQVADAGRVADGVAITARPEVRGYVRMIVGKTCSRCLILAGRRYGWSAGFQRHPRLPMRLPPHPRRRVRAGRRAGQPTGVLRVPRRHRTGRAARQGRRPGGPRGRRHREGRQRAPRNSDRHRRAPLHHRGGRTAASLDAGTDLPGSQRFSRRGRPVAPVARIHHLTRRDAGRHHEEVAMTRTLPIHPFTGLRAIGLRRDGRPIYPVRGGSQPTPAPTPPVDPAPADPPAPTPPADTATDPADKPLGPAGEKAFREEREARKALEKQLAALAPLQKLAEAIGGQQQPGGKSEVERLNERFAELERTAADERAARWRAEIAVEKGITPQLAARLQGATREELAADADALVALLPAATGPRTPAPDPSQGARGGTGAGDLDAQIAQAQKDRDWRRVISLQNQKLAK